MLFYVERQAVTYRKVATVLRSQSAPNFDKGADRNAEGVRRGYKELPKAVRQRITAQLAGGQTLYAIAGSLKAERVPTARNIEWRPSTVRHVLNSVILGLEVTAS